MTEAEIAEVFQKFDYDENSDLDLDEFTSLYEDYFINK